jgi:4,5-DOPA dioxygenase extradiol
MLPSVFISHGAPTVLGEEIPARDFLTGLGAMWPRPKAILVISAHWETTDPVALTADRPETIHDFHGFPADLYRIRYPAPGAPETAARAVALLRDAGISATTDPARGLDHGAWVPLRLAYPRADIPVAQLSIQPSRGAAHHLAVGRALAPLRADDVLILGSGGAIHNLSDLDWGRHDDPPAWALAFDDWLAETIKRNDTCALAEWRDRAPHAVRAHPRDEHFLPLLVACGAGGIKDRGTRLHAGFAHGSLSMAAFRFG